MKVLVVEDVEDSRVLLEDILVSEGYEVTTASDGLEALQQVKKIQPDLIISDILMPEMDGFELCRQLQRDPKFKSIPFIFYTATYTDASDEKLALSLGASRFVIKPEDPPRLLEIIREVVAEHRANVSEKRVIDKDGDHSFEMSYSKTLSKKLNKKVEDLENQKEQLKIITDSVPALISEIDEKGCYLYVNSAYEKWFDLSRDKIIGKNIVNIANKTLYNVVQPYIEKALKGEEAVYEGYVKDVYGNERYILARYIPYKRKNMKHYHCFSFVNDLTEKKQAEDEKQKLLIQLRQSQKMDAIGHLAGGIAHDFNNILGIILGYADLMALAEFENKGGRLELYNQQIRTAGLRGKELVSQIMKFKRNPDEQSEFSIDIKPLLKEVIKLVEDTFPATVAIDSDLDENISPVVIELSKLHQVLVNLLINARDAINIHGQIRVKLTQEKINSARCHSCKQSFSGDFVVLSVSDNGEGIDSNYLEKVFELFFTSKEIGKGTGIGLSMVHSIVHESRGHVSVESVVGEGTTFKLFFPVSNLKEKIPKDNIYENIHTGRIEGKQTIMIVDDELSLAEYLDVLLTQNGYQTEVFIDSEKALQEFELTPDGYDLIITDQSMPNMTGSEMAEKIMRIQPKLPIIIYSGYLSRSDDFLNRINVRKVLQKPVAAGELLHAVKKYLS